jgi:CHAD domain-containing protein
MPDFTAGLLDRPAVQAACAIALSYLDDAERAAARLADRADREALHDLRVAIRRLRVTVRAYPGLHEGLPKKHRRRLRKLVRGTNAARDAEVQIAWFTARAARFTPAQRSALAPIRARLRALHRRELAGARADVAPRFSRLAVKLRRLIEKVKVDAGLHEPPFRAVAGAVLVQHAAELTARLKQISPESDPRALHQTRIAAKRLRYLLEPIEPGLRESASIVDSLKRLQDGFGALTDAHELEVALRDTETGTAAAMSVLQAEAAGAFMQVHEGSATIGAALAKAIEAAARDLQPALKPARSMRQRPRRRARTRV